jgi:hypothetical protein
VAEVTGRKLKRKRREELAPFAKTKENGAKDLAPLAKKRPAASRAFFLNRGQGLE